MRYFLNCVRRGTIVLSVLLGPTLISLAASAVYEGFQPANADGLPLLAFIASTATIWALVGIIAGPSDVPRWFFLVASLVNMVAGFAVAVSDETYRYATAGLYLVFSLWQFIVSRRPRVHHVR